MKSLQSIGMRKAIRFGFGQLVGLLLDLCLFPPVRVVILRMLGARIGRDCVIHACTFINFYRGSFRNLIVGNDGFIGGECLLDLAAPIELGDQVTLANRVTVMTHMNVGYDDHPLQRAFPSRVEGIRIGRGVFVGVGATLLCGVEIGEGSLVGAGALVTESVAPGVVACGVPARVVKSIDSDGE